MAQRPVTLINSFEVPEGRVDECLALWREAAAVLKKQPGYISTHLHRSINDKAKFALVNVAQWESAEHFGKALATPEFQAVAAKMGDFPHHPGLYTVVDDGSDL